MGDLATVSMDRTAVTAAAERAKKQGVSTAEYLSELVFRDLEREPGERSILAYDCLEPGSEFTLDRVEGETDEEYDARSSHVGKLFP